MKLLSFQILRALSVRIIVFGNVVPCSLSDGYHCHNRMWCLAACQMGTIVTVECGAMQLVRWVPLSQ